MNKGEMSIPPHNLHSVIDRQELNEACLKIAEEVDAAYMDTEEPLIVVGLLKGAFIFMSDLVRHLRTPCQLEFMSVSSYGHTTESSGDIRIQQDLDVSVHGRNVLLVEDIVDTGRTFSHVVELMYARNCKTVRTCAMLDKPSRRKVPLQLDFRGIEIQDVFVVGYGLDYAGMYRQLPYIAQVVFEKPD
jgi:hypoxanthine phosphoribosyltransferase